MYDNSVRIHEYRILKMCSLEKKECVNAPTKHKPEINISDNCTRLMLRLRVRSPNRERIFISNATIGHAMSTNISPMLSPGLPDNKNVFTMKPFSKRVADKIPSQ